MHIWAFYIYVYIGILKQTICCFHTPYAFCRSFKQLKKIFYVCLILPRIVGQNRDSALPHTKYFYNMN